ncbi:MAG: PhoH family protein [Calditrichaceae bacterium]
MIETIYSLKENLDPVLFYGHQDINMKLIEDQFPVRLIARGHDVKIIGENQDVAIVKKIFDEISLLTEKKQILSVKDVQVILQIVKANETKPNGAETENKYISSDIALTSNDGYIKPKSDGQSRLLKEMGNNDIVFAIGPAGTGKTYLAVAMASSYLKNGMVKKIVLARPAVEAGESLGFLPGDFKEKIDPYLKPLYDSLDDMFPKDVLKKYLDQEVIEILPLAYMRGRTLNNAFVILDEAQNSTFTQMKMFLTRMGINSKAVITGDITQIDLPSSKDSGLISSLKVLQGIKGISFVKLSKSDVVRHSLVKDIIEAYDKFDKYKPK